MWLFITSIVYLENNKIIFVKKGMTFARNFYYRLKSALRRSGALLNSSPHTIYYGDLN